MDYLAHHEGTIKRYIADYQQSNRDDRRYKGKTVVGIRLSSGQKILFSPMYKDIPPDNRIFWNDNDLISFIEYKDAKIKNPNSAFV